MLASDDALFDVANGCQILVVLLLTLLSEFVSKCFRLFQYAIEHAGLGAEATARFFDGSASVAEEAVENLLWFVEGGDGLSRLGDIGLEAQCSWHVFGGEGGGGKAIQDAECKD